MKKVITYGTYDLLHHGHVRLLERAKKLGDYLIVGVTSDDFDRRRGKINVKQSLAERIEAVKAMGIADEIIIEEYEGQKIDDIKRYGVDIFTVGSDWVGKFDYLNEYCKVVYLDRTEGVSSTAIRSSQRAISLGIIGNSDFISKYISEDKYVNGLEVTGIVTTNKNILSTAKEKNIVLYEDYKEMLDNVDAVYVANNPEKRCEYIKQALDNEKHVICESPISLSKEECEELYSLAHKKQVILMEAIKTAYSTAFNRLMLLVKSGIIGNVVSVDCNCTSLSEKQTTKAKDFLTKQNSMCAWGPVSLLPVFMLLGTDYNRIDFISWFLDKEKHFDLFTKINLNYSNATATIKVGKGVKSEGDLIITGTEGYVYVPAPWWKTDYFEIRFEDTNASKRYFYQLDGEGIRYELVTFIKSIENKKSGSYVDENVSIAISTVMEKFKNKENLTEING